MSFSGRIRDFMDGGYARNRREAVRVIEENSEQMVDAIQNLRTILQWVQANPKQSKEHFDLLMSLYLQKVRDNVDEIKGMKNEEGRFLGLQITGDLATMLLLAEAESVNKAQYLLRVQILELVDALKSETITKEELASKLESIKKELEQKMPTEEDSKNIEWIRNFLRKSSQTGGQGT